MDGTEHRVLFREVLMFFPERGLLMKMKWLKHLAPYTLAITHFGMFWLYLGLLLAVTFEVTGRDLAMNFVPAIGNMPPAYVLANALWIWGAVILVLPPLVDGIMILVVLELFLIISGALSYWQPEHFWYKIGCRIILAVIVFAIVKLGGLLKSKDDKILLCGIEALGFGYALNSMLMLTMGSGFLAVSNWIKYKKTGLPILKPWTILNVAYFITGIIILVCQYAK